MTNEEVIRLDQRVVTLETSIASTQSQVISLQIQLAAANAKVETLNSFYGNALGEMTNRFMALLDKVTSGATPTV
jgi:hypothetical protein